MQASLHSRVQGIGEQLTLTFGIKEAGIVSGTEPVCVRRKANPDVEEAGTMPWPR